jgi:hypothetical protein
LNLSSKKVIIHHSVFLPKPDGHGGERRTAQITELLNQSNINWIELEILKIRIPFLLKIRYTCSALWLLFENGWLWKFKSPDRLKRYVGMYSYTRQKIYKERIDKDVQLIFIWESTQSEYFYLPYLMRKMNARVIGLPHNLESLVPDQYSAVTNKKSPDFFYEELRYLKFCDQIFTISREEEWLLKLFNLNVSFLPYYPDTDLENDLLFVRQARTNKGEEETLKNVLILGTVNNIPTRLGIENRIEYFKQKPLDYNINIVGFGTELFKDRLTGSDNIILHGSVSKEKLEEFLIQTDVVLIHQIASSGALTRIIELLIAGIPVLVNPMGARSYWNYDGIHVYNNDSELDHFLTQFDFRMPEIPEKLNSFSEDFLFAIANKQEI